MIIVLDPNKMEGYSTGIDHQVRGTLFGVEISPSDQ